MRDEWIAAMSELYAAVDLEIASLAPHCRGCGGCCHFDRAEHLLYASRLERLYLLAGAPAPEHPDADGKLLAAGLRCPYQKEGRCLARTARTLGCRLHYCSWPETVQADELSERWHQRLKQLHDRLGVEWDYAPLLPL